VHLALPVVKVLFPEMRRQAAAILCSGRRARPDTWPVRRLIDSQARSVSMFVGRYSLKLRPLQDWPDKQ
jgi:hypothetical protein